MDFTIRHQFADLEIKCADGSLYYSKIAMAIMLGLDDKLAEFTSGVLELKYMHMESMIIILKIHLFQDPGVQKPPDISKLTEIAQFAHMWLLKYITPFLCTCLLHKGYPFVDVINIIAQYKEIFVNAKKSISKYLDEVFAHIDHKDLKTIPYAIFDFADISKSRHMDALEIWAESNSHNIPCIEIWNNITKTVPFRKYGGTDGIYIPCNQLLRIIFMSTDIEFKQRASYTILNEYVIKNEIIKK